MRAIGLAVCLGIASPCFAQLSPDPTEGRGPITGPPCADTPTKPGVWTIHGDSGPGGTDCGLVAGGGTQQANGIGDAYLWTGGQLYVYTQSTGHWYRWTGTSWLDVGDQKPVIVSAPPPVPNPPSPVTYTIDGKTMTFAAVHDGLSTDRYQISVDGVWLTDQTRDVAALVNGQIQFILPAVLIPATHTYIIAAVNSVGSSSSPPFTVNFQAPLLVPSWACMIPAAISKYANGDLKVTLRCPSTFPGVKGDRVTVTKP